MSSQPDLREACATGALEQVSYLLDSARQQQQPPTYPHAELLKAAMDGKNLTTLRYLLTTFRNDNPLPWKRDYTVVMMAAEKGRLEEFKLLWEADSSVATAYLGHTGNVLGFAVLAQNIPLVSFLLGVGVDPNNAQLFHRPVVTWLVEKGEVEVMDILLDHGVRIERVEALKKMAQENGHERMVKLLAERGGGISKDTTVFYYLLLKCDEHKLCK